MEDIDIERTLASDARIKVIGVGGAGGNAVQHMIASGLNGVSFVCANTDLQALKSIDAPVKVQLGEKLTRGLGAGANPQVGKESALESVGAIREALKDADMVFVTAGLGGGTGTGAAPVVAQAAKEMGALTVGVVTKPFSYEGGKRRIAAEAGLEEFRKHVDCLITIPNDRLMAFAPKKTPFKDLLKKANDVLYYAVKGISDVIMTPGLINVDFADVRTVMCESGLALMGTGVASGENRAREAAHKAIMSPLLEEVSLEGAKAVLFNITASSEISGEEVHEVGAIISEVVHSETTEIIMGVVFNEDMGDELRITVVATGIENMEAMQLQSPTNEIPFSQPRRPVSVGSAASSRRTPPQTMPMQPAQEEPSPAPSFPPRPSRRERIGDWYDGKSEVPPFVRKNEALGQVQRRTYTPGAEELYYKESDDLQVPTFIRRQAD